MRPILVLLLLASPAFADVPLHDPFPAPQSDQARVVVPPGANQPDPAPVPVAAPPGANAPDLPAKLAATDAVLHSLAATLGAPMPTALPASFWDSSAGKAVTWVFVGLGVAVSVAQAAATIDAQFFPAK